MSPSWPTCPPPLPPDPPLVLQPLLPLLDQANQALGRLDGLASILPDPSLFIYLYVRKEAVLSSQIEGTQSSFSDLMLFESAEAPSVPLEDVQEVSNHVAAMNHGLRRLRKDFPLSLRLIREIHKILLCKERSKLAARKQPHVDKRGCHRMVRPGTQPEKFKLGPGRLHGCRQFQI
jgi:Fic family protein